MIAILITTLLQVLAYAFVPFLVYVVRHRKVKGFPAWIGFRRAPRRAWLIATAFTVVLAVPVLWMFSLPGLREMATGPGTSASYVRGAGGGINAIVLLLLIAWLQTGLAEEILFRGFVAQRLIDRLGFVAGNTLQALLFGVLHVVLYMGLAKSELPLYQMAVLFLVPGLIAFALGWLKVRAADGSILPGWWAHGLSNTLAVGIMAFLWS